MRERRHASRSQKHNKPPKQNSSRRDQAGNHGVPLRSRLRPGAGPCRRPGGATGPVGRGVHARAGSGFRRRTISPGTEAGRKLLSHELTRVVQQDGAPDGFIHRRVYEDHDPRRSARRGVQCQAAGSIEITRALFFSTSHPSPAPVGPGAARSLLLLRSPLATTPPPACG
ncbi:MAG: DUF4157 domain-containing protein [Candidatus Manganitrophaceae bacterium]|nr:MAG: DUF4157 domain-containing protein [Candidatus Manganitrophaceae bacterium]